MFKRKFFKSLSIIALAIFVSGCSISINGSENINNKINGGIYKSVNQGLKWNQTVSIPSTAGVGSFAFANILDIAIDPQDNQTLYVGTLGSGMLYSYDGGVSWDIAKKLGKVSVQSVAVSPDSKCVIYVAAENRIVKSIDCSREWAEVYYDNNLGVSMNSLAIHPTNPKIVYAGTSRGEVIFSSNYGQSWSTLKRFDKGSVIQKILINKKSPNTIYIVTPEHGIYKTSNGGASWTSFQERFMEINTQSANLIHDMALAGINQETIVVATKAGVIRSFDSGAHWRLVDLVPPSDQTEIRAIAVNPLDQDEIYYATATSFGFSEDGGENWTSKKLPTNRAGSEIVIDFKDPKIVYLGVKTILQEK